MTPLRKGQDDQLNPKKIVGASRVVTPAEVGVALLLVLAGLAPLFLFWFYASHKTPFNQQDVALLVILGIYVFCVIETFAIFLLWGFQRLTLPSAFVHWLGGASVGEISGLLVIAFKYVFHR